VTFLKEQSEGLLSTYNRPPLIFTQGKGSYIYDTQDREYLDFSAGIAVNALGHADPEVSGLICPCGATREGAAEGATSLRLHLRRRLIRECLPSRSTRLPNSCSTSLPS
jgi:glutamate-1-semialdehyde aminotransferase